MRCWGRKWRWALVLSFVTSVCLVLECKPKRPTNSYLSLTYSNEQIDKAQSFFPNVKQSVALTGNPQTDIDNQLVIIKNLLKDFAATHPPRPVLEMPSIEDLVAFSKLPDDEFAQKMDPLRAKDPQHDSYNDIRVLAKELAAMDDASFKNFFNTDPLWVKIREVAIALVNEDKQKLKSIDKEMTEAAFGSSTDSLTDTDTNVEIVDSSLVQESSLVGQASQQTSAPTIAVNTTQGQGLNLSGEEGSSPGEGDANSLASSPSSGGGSIQGFPKEDSPLISSDQYFRNTGNINVDGYKPPSTSVSKSNFKSSSSSVSKSAASSSLGPKKPFISGPTITAGLLTVVFVAAAGILIGYAASNNSLLDTTDTDSKMEEHKDTELKDVALCLSAVMMLASFSSVVGYKRIVNQLKTNPLPSGNREMQNKVSTRMVAYMGVFVLFTAVIGVAFGSPNVNLTENMGYLLVGSSVAASLVTLSIFYKNTKLKGVTFTGVLKNTKSALERNVFAWDAKEILAKDVNKAGEVIEPTAWHTTAGLLGGVLLPIVGIGIGTALISAGTGNTNSNSIKQSNKNLNLADDITDEDALLHALNIPLFKLLTFQENASKNTTAK